jgi:hypothetical protein
VGPIKLVNIPTVVVFPAPFGPKNPKTSPWSMDRSKSTTAGISAPFFISKILVKAFVLIKIRSILK